MVLVLLARTAHANPVDAFGFGARGPAMGGAQTAATDDGGANYYNPAALARAHAIRFDVAYQLAAPRLELNGGDQDVDSSRGFALSLSAPGKILGTEVAFGVGIFLPDERLIRSRTLPPGTPRWALYDNRPQCIFLASSLAIALGPRLSLGGSIAYLSRTEGGLELDGRVGLPVAEDSDLALAIDIDLVAVHYFQAGLLYKATPFLDVGLSYRGGFVFELSQAFAITGDIGPPGGPPVVTDAYFKLDSLALDLFQPEQWSAGFALRATRRVLVAGDLTWQRWSAYENPSARIEIDLDLNEFNDMVNLPEAAPIEPAYFHDVVVPRLGIEVLAARSEHVTWRARAGYAYEPSPAPEQATESNFVDNDKHTLSIGVGAEIARVPDVVPLPFDIDLFAAGSVLPERAHAKLRANDPVGDYVSKGVVWQMGLGTRWQF